MARCSRSTDVAVVIASSLALVDSARRASTRPRVGPFEERVFRRFNGAPDRIRWPAWVVMQAGSLPAVFVVGGGFAAGGRRRAAAVTIISGVGVWGGVKAIKPLVGRGRPVEYLDGVVVRGVQQNGLGYPSGHAAVAITLARLVARSSSDRVRAAAVGLAATAGGARMFVGAHLPLDVAGGLALGTLAGRATTAVLTRWSPERTS